ncbi:MAG: sodium-dependent transporter [Butyrivibrio sp.]|nr:sodium-dependent transporter [Butyrivibrio sp.]
MEKKREGFGSRLGFILVSAGCAIGIGNVWKFPYVAGQNGGAIFVLFYLLFLVIMGIPVLTMELAIGRASRKTIIKAYKKLEPEGSKWHLHGWVCLAGCYLLMMYYTTVAGWMVAYFWKFLTGAFNNVDGDQIATIFTDMLADPVEMTTFMFIVVIAGFLVLSFGVQNGLERANKIMMIGLLALIMILAVNSVTLPNAVKGISFYLLPNIDNVRHVGIGKVITAAMNQAFFTLSLGIAAMEIFGSYISKEHTLRGEAIKITALDTFVAFMAGLIVFPACFSFDVQPDQGPSLIFIILPNVFTHMAGGRIWGTLFFLFMTFASFSTVTAVFENLVGSAMDNFKWDRTKAVVINCIFMLVASMPCLLGYNVLSNVHLIGGRDILDSEDFIVSNLMLPIGSLIFLLFCVTKYGWGADKFFGEINTGEGRQSSTKLLPYYRFVLPVLILIILITGLI